jgi:hypothetical protein
MIYGASLKIKQKVIEPNYFKIGDIVLNNLNLDFALGKIFMIIGISCATNYAYLIPNRIKLNEMNESELSIIKKNIDKNMTFSLSINYKVGEIVIKNLKSAFSSEEVTTRIEVNKCKDTFRSLYSIYDLESLSDRYYYAILNNNKKEIEESNLNVFTDFNKLMNHYKSIRNQLMTFTTEEKGEKNNEIK